MWRFVLVSFVALGWSFYVLSGGADYEPVENSIQVQSQIERPDPAPAETRQETMNRQLQTLAQVEAERVALLHLDMNCAPPEAAAAAFFWPRLTPGAFLLLDDYAYRGFGAQKAAMDAFARERDLSILALPTGQGLMVKPLDGVTA